MTNAEFKQWLSQFPDDAKITFSMAIDDSPDPAERWFCEDRPVDILANRILAGSSKKQPITQIPVCLVGETNEPEDGWKSRYDVLQRQVSQLRPELEASQEILRLFALGGGHFDT